MDTSQRASTVGGLGAGLLLGVLQLAGVHLSELVLWIGGAISAGLLVYGILPLVGLAASAAMRARLRSPLFFEGRPVLERGHQAAQSSLELAEPAIEFPEWSFGDPLDSRPEYRKWAQLKLVNHGTATARGCYGQLEVVGPSKELLPRYPCAFVGDYPQPNPTQTLDIPPFDQRIWVAVYMVLEQPTILHFDQVALGRKQPIQAGTYLTSWNHIQDIERHPLPKGTYEISVVVHDADGSTWRSPPLIVQVEQTANEGASALNYPKLDGVTRAYAGLVALRQNLPDSVTSRFVDEYESLLDSLQKSGQDVEGFRVPRSELKRVIRSFNYITGQTTYGHEPEVDRNYFLAKLDAVVGYIGSMLSREHA